MAKIPNSLKRPSKSQEVSGKIGCDGGLITWISAKPTDWTPEVNYYTSWRMAETFSIMRRTSCSSLSRVLSTRSSCSTSPASPTASSQDYEKFMMCPAKKYEVRVWVNKHNETCHKPSHRTTNKHGETVTAWIAMRKGVTGKEFTLTSWKTEIAKRRRARTTWTLCLRRTGEAILRAAK